MSNSKGMNIFERAFMFGLFFAHILLLLKVAFESTKWNQPEFIFAYSSCWLTFAQFLIRYLAITYRFRTETSPSAWGASILILVTSLASTQGTLHIPLWFLPYGLLLLLASIKTQQSRTKVREASIKGDVAKETATERLMRLQEYMIFERGCGIIMIFLYVVSTGLLISTPDAACTSFFGALFALFYAIISTLINIARVYNYVPLINKEIEGLP